jgi:hypothetical protein
MTSGGVLSLTEPHGNGTQPVAELKLRATNKKKGPPPVAELKLRATNL